VHKASERFSFYVGEISRPVNRWFPSVGRRVTSFRTVTFPLRTVSRPTICFVSSAAHHIQQHFVLGMHTFNVVTQIRVSFISDHCNPYLLKMKSNLKILYETAHPTKCAALVNRDLAEIYDFYFKYYPAWCIYNKIQSNVIS